MESSLSIFEEEFISIANERTFIILADVIKMNPTDDNNLFKINFMHIRIFILIHLINSNIIFHR